MWFTPATILWTSWEQVQTVHLPIQWRSQPPDEENTQTEPPLISIIPAPSSKRTPHGEKDTYGINRDEFTKSTPKLDKSVDKIRSTQEKHSSPTKTTHGKEPEKMEHSFTETKAPKIIYLDSSNSSKEISRNTEELRQSTHSEIYNSLTVHRYTKHRRHPQNVTPYRI